MCFSSEELVSEESLHLSCNEVSSFVELVHVHSTSIVVKKYKLNSSQRTSVLRYDGIWIAACA